jgi:hypothetical protein
MPFILRNLYSIKVKSILLALLKYLSDNIELWEIILKMFHFFAFGDVFQCLY